MYIRQLDYWRFESAYDFVNDLISDEDFHKAFPMLTKEEFIDDPDQLWNRDYTDWDIIYAVIQQWDGYYTVYSDEYEYIIIKLEMPEHLDPNNISHYKRN